MTSSGGTPTGTLTFEIDGVTQTPVPLVAGAASFTAPGLAGGTHTVKAHYNGATNFSPSDATLTGGQLVNPAATATALTLGSPTSHYGDTISVTARVTSAAGSPSGTVIFSIDGVPGPSATLTAGEAATTLSGLAFGARNITAAFQATTSFSASTSATASHLVTQAPASLSVTASPEPTVSGQSVTFTAQVSSTGGVPTGSVIFTIDGTATTVPLTNGRATIPRADLPVGNHAVAVAYGGDTNFLATSATLPGGHTVNRAATTTTLSAPASTGTFGAPLTLTADIAAVAPGIGTPAGSVIFSLNGAPQPAQPLTNGKATLTLGALAVNTYAITAVYSGDGAFLQSTGSLSGGYDVRAADTALVLTAQPEPSRFGDEVTLRAEVTSSGGTPTGSVIFTVDGQVLPAENLQSGIATAKVTGLAVPSTPITAIYQGAASFNASPLASISHIVNLAQTSVSITSSAPAVTLGEDVTFTVTVHSPAGTPTGKIDILYGSTVIADDIDLVGGSASFTHSLPTGTHTITAIYAGDTKFEPSTGTLSGGQKVNPSAVTLALSTSANPIAYGQPGTISVTLTSAGGVPSGGNVTFTIDGADYPAPLTNGLATLSLPTLEPGLYPITASYAGSSDFLAVSSTMTNGLTIQRAPANLTLTPPAPTAVYGDSIVVEASVASGSLSPTGTVTFSVDGVPRAPVTLANGLATLDLAGLGVGSHAITATYSGDSHIAQASATLSGNVVITPAAATMTLSATPPTAEFGGPIELVADLGSGAGTPAGTVVFTVGGTAYPAVTLVSGKARLVLDALTVGSHPVSAAFAAQKNHAAIGATLAAPLVVTHKTTNLVLTSSGPTEVGETATFRAQLSAGSLSPTGAIKFIFDGDPSSAVTATMSNGVATYSRAFAAGGTHQVDAVFAGDLEFAPAAAALLGGQVVSAADTELRLSASPASPAFGDHVTVTASVSALSASAGTPSGLVEFSLDGAVLGRSALAAGSASFDLPVLSAGTHRIRADYIASRDHAASFAEISSFAVARAAPTVTLSASPNPAVAGAPVTIEVHVSSPAGIPSGSVTLTGLGTYSLDASGILAFAPTFAAGSYAIEAHFLGDDDFAPSTSAQVSLQVDPPPVAVSFLAQVPTGTVGESYHGSISAVGGTGTYSVSADANFPQGLNLDPTTGEITGIPAAAGTFSFDITATNGLTAPVVQTFSIIVLDPVTVSSASLPNGVAGASYLSAPLTAAGGTAPYIFALSGAPSGITLNGSNEIAGTTTQTGSFDFVVTATDANGAIGVQTYRVTFEAPTIQLVTSIPAGEVGMPYQGSVTASGGAGSLTISVSTGQLPPGLHLDPDTGDITGIPTAAGSYPVTFTAEDDNGFTGTASATFVTAIVPVITLPTSLPPGRENRFYSQSLAATGATAPYTYTITSGALPTGFGLDSGTGLLSGTPTVSGPVDFTITVTDSAGTTPAVQRYTFTIAAASTLTMNTPATVPGGLPYTHDFAAAGGSGNYTYRIVSGTLPLGLAFDPAGTISGVATEAGAFGLIVEVTDTTSGDKFTKNFVLDVEAPIISVTASSTSATFDMAYSATLTALGGQGTYTYSSPNLPAWLSFGSADTIIGTPPLAGSITFDILAEDANGFTGTTPITLVIAPPDIDLGALSDLAHQTTRPYSASFPVTGGVGPYSFRVTSGNLPPGITLAAGTAAQGTLSGTPTVAGTFTFTIEAEDANQFVGETSYTIVITSHLGSAQLPAILSTWVAGEAGTATAGVTNDASTFVYTSVGLPAGLELDDRTGEITGTLDSVGDYAFTIIATKDSNGLENSRSYVLSVIAPTFLPSNTLSPGTAGLSYSGSVAVSGGKGPYTFTAPSGMPTGLTFDAATGAFGGTPTEAGTFTISVPVEDRNRFTGSVSYSLTIAAPVITLTGTTLTDGIIAAAYVPYQFLASGNGAGTLSYAISAGTLPAGLSLAPDGTLSGTPTVQGSFSFEVTARDANGFTGAALYELDVLSNVSTTLMLPSTIGNWSFKQTDSRSLAASNATAAARYSISAGILPPGITIDAVTGMLSGTPTSAGTFPFEVTVHDGPHLKSQTYSLVVTPPVLSLPGTPSTTGRVGVAYAANFTASSTLAGSIFTYTLADAPPGLSIDTSGDISGVPTSTGTFTVTVKATDADGFAATSTFTLTIAPAFIPLILPLTLPPAENGIAYSQSLEPSNGTAPYTVVVTPGALPPGLSISANTLSGTPTADIDFTFTVDVTDDLGNTGTRTYTLSVAPAGASLPKSTSTSLTVSPATPAIGQTVTLSAIVSSSAGTPTGFVVFEAGGVILDTVLLDAGGNAEIQVPAAAQNLQAKFLANTDFAGSDSTPVSVSPNAAETELNVNGVLTVSQHDEPVVVVATASRKSPSTGLPSSGTIEIYLNGTLVDTASTTTGTLTFAEVLDPGIYTLRAVYTPDSNALDDPAETEVEIRVEADTHVLITGPASNTEGAVSTFIATVSTVPAHPTIDPTGDVEFMAGSTSLGTQPLVNGEATLVTDQLPAGLHNIWVNYSGHRVFRAFASRPLAHQVVPVIATPQATTTALSLSTSTPVISQVVTLEALVTTNSALVPTGQVDFIDRSTGAIIGTGFLDSTGRTSIDYAFFDLGQRDIDARYLGDGTFDPSDTSASITASSAPTTLTLSASAAQTLMGEPVTLTATVDRQSPATGLPSSAVVEFFADGNLIGTAVTNGTSSADFITAPLTADTVFTARYLGPVTQIDATSQSTPLNHSVVRDSVGMAVDVTANGPDYLISATLTPAVLTGRTPSGTLTLQHTDGLFADQVVTLTGNSAQFTVPAALSRRVSILSRYPMAATPTSVPTWHRSAIRFSVTPL